MGPLQKQKQKQKEKKTRKKGTKQNKKVRMEKPQRVRAHRE